MLTGMTGYTKLFNSILASTVWDESSDTRVVWITLLALADRTGTVEASVPGLAVFARLPVEATRLALIRLSAPDPDSRSQEHEGRRIEAIEGGWLVLNHGKYRAKLGVDERREYNRLKQRQYRQRQHSSLTVNHGEQSNHKAEAEAEAEAKKSTRKEPRKARPIFKGSRITVFQWQVTELASMLGPHAEDFDLEEWIRTLDEASRADSLVIADSWEFLKARTLVEAARRGLVSSDEPKPTKQELQTAQRVRQNQFGCRHQPRCVTTEACILAIVKELRAKSYQEAPR